MAELRSFIFIDQLQPQTLCYMSTWMRGSLPRAGVAAQVIEVAPGLDIEALTDIAVKHAEVRAGILVVERQFGYLEFHSRDTSAVKGIGGGGAGRARSRRGPDATRPKILGSKVITNLSHQHAFLVNRNKLGSMVIAGETLYTLEVQPASYSALAANAAEKAARIKLVDYRMIGANGRVYLAGSEADIPDAREAAESALHALGAGDG